MISMCLNVGNRSFGLNVPLHRIFDQNWSNFVDTSGIWYCYWNLVSHTRIQRHKNECIKNANVASFRKKTHILKCISLYCLIHEQCLISCAMKHTNAGGLPHFGGKVLLPYDVGRVVELQRFEGFSLMQIFSILLTDCICTWVHFEGMETPLRGVQRIITVFHCFWRIFLVYVGLENHEKDMVLPWYSIDTSYRCSCFEVSIC